MKIKKKKHITKKKKKKKEKKPITRPGIDTTEWVKRNSKIFGLGLAPTSTNRSTSLSFSRSFKKKQSNKTLYILNEQQQATTRRGKKKKTSPKETLGFAAGNDGEKEGSKAAPLLF